MLLRAIGVRLTCLLSQVPQLVSADAANLGAKTYLVFGTCMVGIIIFAYFFIRESLQTARGLEVRMLLTMCDYLNCCYYSGNVRAMTASKYPLCTYTSFADAAGLLAKSMSYMLLAFP